MSKINEEAGSEVVKSRYSIVMGTAKRARQMVDKGYMELEDHSRRPLSIAVEELYDGDIRILNEEETADYQVRFAEKLAREAELLAQREAEARERAAAEAAQAKRSFKEDDEDEDEPEDGEPADDYTEDAAELSDDEAADELEKMLMKGLRMPEEG
jgi:DNA-directed RNA polymerase subunit omega